MRSDFRLFHSCRLLGLVLFQALLFSSCGEKAIDQTKNLCTPMVTNAVNDINNRCWYLEAAADERTVKTHVTYLVESCINLDRSGVSRCRMATNQKGEVEISTYAVDDLCKQARAADRDSGLAMEYASNGTFVSPWKDLSYHPTRASTD